MGIERMGGREMGMRRVYRHHARKCPRGYKISSSLRFDALDRTSKMKIHVAVILVISIGYICLEGVQQLRIDDRPPGSPSPKTIMNLTIWIIILDGAKDSLSDRLADLPMHRFQPMHLFESMLDQREKPQPIYNLSRWISRVSFLLKSPV